MVKLGHTKRRTITAATAVIALGLLSFGAINAAQADVTAGNPAVVYDATITPLPGNLVSQGFQATQTAELGDHVTLAGTNRVLRSATVTMSTWALASDYPALAEASATGWTHPITFKIYSVAGSPTEPALGTPIGQVTEMVDIPWRPAADPTNCEGSTAWYSAGDAKCYNGFAFNVTFDLSTIGTVPDEIIYGVAYNTNTWGAAPISQPGPYESLNVALNDGTATISGDVDPDAVFWNTKTAGWYADLGHAGTGTFRRDTNWTGYVPAVRLTASVGNCSFSESGDTLTLLGDCTTDQTILVPSGKTLDGNGHSITAVDPTGGHFVGAVVEDAGTSASVKNLTVTASNLATACDAFPNSLAGIRLDGAAGSITNNTVTGIQHGSSGDGCQEGNAIEVRNTAGTGTPSVTVTGNTVSDYQKTGVLVKGHVAAVVTGNTVAGYGPVDFIAQNGIQVSFGATAQVTDNVVSDNFYSPESNVACGLIIYEAGGVKIAKNTFSGNEKNLCNVGRGGGKFGGV